MPLAYYSRSATKEFWTEHWGAHSVDELARVARSSPLTDLILRGLPPAGARVVEAGCGVGQYVLLLRGRGYGAVGLDWSLEALRTCRAAVPGTPLAVMDLRRLGVRSGAFAAYLSLGVVEHDPDGPDPILQEARRVLGPGGVLLVSVPYINVMRWLGARWIRRRSERLKRAGGEFYQYAFSRREARAFVERNGFRVLALAPYDPARLLRAGWRRLTRMVAMGGPPGGDGTGPETAALPTSLRGALRRALYTRPALHALGHMILLTAVKR